MTILTFCIAIMQIHVDFYQSRNSTRVPA